MEWSSSTYYWFIVHNRRITISNQSNLSWNINWSMAVNHGNNNVIPK